MFPAVVLMKMSEFQETNEDWFKCAVNNSMRVNKHVRTFIFIGFISVSVFISVHKASVFLSRLPAQISKDSEIKIYWRSEMTEDQKRSEFVFKTRNNLVFPLN